MEMRCIRCGLEIEKNRRLFRFCNKCAFRTKVIVFILYLFCIISIPLSVFWGWHLPRLYFFSITFCILLILFFLGWYTLGFYSGSYSCNNAYNNAQRDYVNILDRGFDIQNEDNTMTYEADLSR